MKNPPYLCLFMLLLLNSCNLYQYNPYWDKHPAQKRRLVKQLIKHIHDQEDILHIDLTPSVCKLQWLGLEALEGCMTLLDDSSSLTRLRVERAAWGAASTLLERNNPDRKAFQENTRIIYEYVGYDWKEEDPAIRKQALDRWKLWLEEAKKKYKKK